MWRAMIDDIEWRVSPGLTSYEVALAEMEIKAGSRGPGSTLQ